MCGVAQDIEIGPVAEAVGQADIEVGVFLAQRVVALAVHRKGEHSLFVAENMRGAVALMHIQVDNEDTPGQLLIEQIIGGHGLVVKTAKTFAAVGKGVVGAAGHIHRHAVFEREQGALDGALCNVNSKIKLPR